MENREFSQIYELIPKRIEKALSAYGITIPDNPVFSDKPLRWLLRGEHNYERLIGKSEKDFKPQFGKMGSYGVFMTDCYSSLLQSEAGVYYLYDSTDLTDDWIACPSNLFNDFCRKAGDNLGLDIKTIEGGVRSEQEVYKNNPVYEKRLGIATYPYVLPFESVNMILATRNLAGVFESYDVLSKFNQDIIFI